MSILKLCLLFKVEAFLSDLRINFIITDGVFLIKRGKIFIIISNYLDTDRRGF
jgi:hypothetical protein